jgi:glycosyltransferase involved in cell wall biosynthesis
MALTASIVINTLNRAESLARTLESLRYLDYSDFEVIVVNGPSTDGTETLLELWEKDIKTGSCPEANLSISRNIGIAMAAGDIVAFIDDDAIPEPEWLSRIVAGYDADEVGGVGGPAFDHTGHSFQSKFLVRDRFGGVREESNNNPTDLFNFPFTREYYGFLGANSSFRRDLLLDIGGFDEEYEYWGDETDVCVRMVDSGYMVKYVDDAFIHHKFLPSNIRNDRRVVTNWYPVIKNQAYFSAKNALEVHSFAEVSEQIFRFIDFQRECAAVAVDDLDRFATIAEDALRTGLERGLAQPRQLLSAATLERHEQPFKRFPTLVPDHGERLTVCYLTYHFPPGFYGGIARFSYDLAYGLARRGHNVHVITTGEGHDTVDFEDGVWVHRIVARGFELPDIPHEQPVSRGIHNWARTVFEEIRQIESHHHIDIIEAPIWNSEGLCLIRDESFKDRTVVSLETTIRIAADSYASWRDSPDIRRAAEIEEYVLKNARAFHAISRGIVASIEERYGLELPPESIGHVPLGVRDESGNYPPSGSATGEGPTVLFVGRLEQRKGIDTLLAVIPGILKQHPAARFVLVGENTTSKLPDQPGPTYRDEFLKEHAGEPILERIHFTGHVSEEELYRHYAACDIFVAPSRYESFGLIFLEAMMFGKPVIGCRSGGMVELIENSANGFLIEPGDPASLSEAIVKLIEDPALRERFGERSRQLYEERFADEKMVDNILEFYRGVVAANRQAVSKTTLSREPDAPAEA